MKNNLESKKALRSYTRAASRKYTIEREEMLAILPEMKGHFTAVDLIKAAKGKAIHANSTIYRNLHILVDAGLINEIRLAGGKTVYEYNDDRKHHDHLVCVGCGKIVPIPESPELRKLHRELEKKHDFRLASYVHTIKGYCQDCMKRVNTPRVLN